MTRQSKTLRILFIGAIVFLIVLSFFTYRRLTALIELGQLVNRTTQLTLELEKTLGSFKDAETGFRGYLLSRDRRFLEPFYAGLNEYPMRLEKIKSALKGNADQQQNLETLENLMVRHKSDMQLRLESGWSDQIAGIELEQGKILMDSIRLIVNSMIGRENAFMEERGRLLQKHMLLAPAMILMLSLLAFIILFISYWQLNKSLNRSRDLREVMIRQNVQLEKKKDLQNIFDQAPVPMVVFRGRDFIIEIINDVALKLLGQARSAVMNKSLFEVAPQLEPIMSPILTQIMASGKLFKGDEFPLQFIHDGQPYNGYFDFICQPTVDETGQPTGIIAIGAEVTESVLARKQIQKSEERYRDLSLSLEEKVAMRTSELKKEKDFSETIIDTTLDMIGVYDTELRILVLNKACANYFKINREEVIGKVYTELFPNAKDTKGHRDLLRSLNGETIHNKVYYSPVSHRYYENFLSPLRDDQGVVYAALVIAHDITDTVESSEKINKANASLQEHNQFIETLLNSSPDQITVLDKDFRIISVNKKAQMDFNGQAVDSINGKTVSEIYPPDEATRIFDGVSRAFGGESVISDKTKSALSDQYFKHQYIPLKNLNQEVYAVMIISQDITAQVTNELALKESEEKFNKLFQFSPFSLSLAGIPDGKFVDVNQHFSRTFGYAREEVIGRTTQDLDMMDAESRQKILSELQAQGTVKNAETELRALSGEKIPVLLSIEKISIGEKNYYLNAIIDIIERKEAESKIAQKNSELEKMNKELQSFAYISSHDLQEPLRKIQTFATRILEREYEGLSDTVKDSFRRMQIAASRMQALIDDLLAYSRTSTEVRKFEFADLNQIVEEIKEDLKEDIKNKQAVIETGDLGKLHIIPFQFRQMLHNLIGNSLKFSHPVYPPHIIIRVKSGKGVDLDPELLPEKKYYHISVSDNGIGFEPVYKDKIFEVFQRLHDKNKYAGTGVGLAIVKKIVENHFGKIKATSELNQGATFDIYIPALG